MQQTNNTLDFNPASLLVKYLAPTLLDRYFELLMVENRKVNLVSRETSRTSFDRMVAECLLPLEITPGLFHRYLDIGAGGGLPAIPLLLSKTIQGQAVLLERTAKKLKALKYISRNLGLSDIDPVIDPAIAVQFVNRTFEEYQPDELFDLITLRFVKLTPVLFRRIASQLAPQGVFVYYSQPKFATDSIASQTYSFTGPEDKAVKHLTIMTKT